MSTPTAAPLPTVGNERGSNQEDEMTHGVHAVQHEVEHEIKHRDGHGGHTGLLDNVNKKVALLIGV